MSFALSVGSWDGEPIDTSGRGSPYARVERSPSRDPDRRQAILADSRDLHRELFAGFTAAGYPECAGTYRGTPDTALADIRMSAPSQIDPDVVYEFCPPREVPWLMTELRLNTRSLLYEPDQEDYDKLIALAYTAPPPWNWSTLRLWKEEDRRWQGSVTSRRRS